MNRAEMLRELAALEALAGAMRAALKDEAAAEFAGNGQVPSWKSPDGTTAVGSMHQDRCEVVDPDAFMAWMVEHMPQMVHTVVVPRDPKVVAAYLADVAESGPNIDPDTGRRPVLKPGETGPNAAGIPGVVYVQGGSYKTVSITFPPAVKRRLTEAAVAYLASGDEGISDLVGLFRTRD